MERFAPHLFAGLVGAVLTVGFVTMPAAATDYGYPPPTT